MRSFILLGNSDSKQKFIDDFISKNNIPSFNIINFEEPLLIAHVREIKKTLKTQSLNLQNRVFIINSNPTLAAQNALLKTLEELDDSTDFIFAGEQELLPTIQSRSTLVNLEIRIQNSESEKTEQIRNIFKTNKPAEILIYIDNFFSTKNEKPFEELILTLRAVLIEAILNKEIDIIKKSNLILSKLIKQNSLVLSNNLNPRICVERIMLEHFINS